MSLLEDILRRLAQGPELPEFAELEPGALLHFIKREWTKQTGDGRRTGTMSEQGIAKAISKTIDRPYSQSTFQAMFGEGVRAGRDGKRAQQPVPRDVAEAFLHLVLRQHWSVDKSGNGMPVSEQINLDQAIRNACNAMFPENPFPVGSGGPRERPVFCRLGPGQGPVGLYREMGQKRASLIVATRYTPVVMDNFAAQIPQWLELMHLLFRPAAPADDASGAEPVHVWAILEPVIDAQPDAIRAQGGIAALREVFWIVNNIVSVQGKQSSDFSLWEILKRRCVIAIKTNARNAPRPKPIAITAQRFIDEAHIFPAELPDRWFSAGGFESQDAANLNTIVRIEKSADRHTVGYYLFREYEKDPPKFAARIMASPGPHDDSFVNLYCACAQFADGKAGKAHKNAESEGWAFLHIQDVFSMTLPIRNESESSPNKVGAVEAGLNRRQKG